MTLSMLFLTALGLSMDAFAVSISNGISYRRYTAAQQFATAFAFGLFQCLMPLLGWLAGSAVSGLIRTLDHWIALLLLGYLGCSMILGAVLSMRGQDEACTVCAFTPRHLLMQAVATSIDALAVGITFAALDVDIVRAALLIGPVTFVCSLIGIQVGRRFGAVFKSRAEIFGGAILVFIGLKIFIEHLLE